MATQFKSISTKGTKPTWQKVPRYKVWIYTREPDKVPDGEVKFQMIASIEEKKDGHIRCVRFPYVGVVRTGEGFQDFSATALYDGEIIEQMFATMDEAKSVVEAWHLKNVWHHRDDGVC